MASAEIRNIPTTGAPADAYRQSGDPELPGTTIPQEPLPSRDGRQFAAALLRISPALITDTPTPCKGMDYYPFYGPSKERDGSRRVREAAAKELCGHCAVMPICLQVALANNEQSGVWGGMTEDDRRRIVNRRRRVQ
ncbi:MAG: WhiB family transcriptional regulator [Candidatus Saccharimonadales bacterium]